MEFTKKEEENQQQEEPSQEIMEEDSPKRSNSKEEEEEDNYSSDSDSQWHFVDVEKFQDVLYQSFEDSTMLPNEEEQKQEATSVSTSSSSHLSNSSSSQLSSKTHSTVNSYTQGEESLSGEKVEDVVEQATSENKSIDASRMLSDYMVTSEKNEAYLIDEVVSEEGSEEYEDSVVGDSIEQVDLEIALQSKDETITELTTELMKCTSDLNNAQQELVQLRHEKLMLEDKCASLDKKQQQIRGKNFALEQELQMVCVASDEKYKKLRTEKQSLEDKFQKEASSYDEQHRKLFYEYRELELQFAQLQSEKSAQDRFLEKIQDENKGKDNLVSVLQQELNDMMENLTLLRNENLERYESEDNAKRDALLLEFSEQKREFEGTIAELTSEITGLRDHLVKKISDAERDAVEFQNVNELLKKEMATLRRENATFKDEIVDLTKESSHLQDEINALVERYANLESENVELTQLNDNLGNERQNMQYISDLVKEQETMFHEVIRVLRNWKERVTHLETESRKARQVKESGHGVDNETEEKDNRGSENIPELLSEVNDRLAELENEVTLMISHVVSQPPQKALLSGGQEDPESNMKISLRRFEPNDIAIFFPTPKGEYLAFNVGAPHHFLSAESKALIGQDKHFQKVYVLGRIIMKESFTVEGTHTPGGDRHPKGLSNGVQYHALSVTSVTNQLR